MTHGTIMAWLASHKVSFRNRDQYVCPYLGEIYLFKVPEEL